MNRAGFAVGMGALAWLGTAGVAAGEVLDRFEPLPPVWKVVDEHVPEAPEEHESNVIGDSFKTLFSRRIFNALGLIEPSLARDINSLDEVPDSSWFEERIGRRPITAEDAFYGPNAHDGSSAPPAGSKLLVVSAKLIGANPGFIVQDVNKTRYVVKFDPPHTPEMQTAADVIGTRLAWLLGYHVPQDNLFQFTRDQLSIKEGVEVRDKRTGKARPMTDADLDDILRRAHQNPDKTFRVLLSRFISGKPRGGTPQEGVRKDDPNDRIPHEDRRSLRAWRLFGAWIKHTDLKEDNMLDSYVTEDGKSFLKHYFIDFGEIFAAQAGEGGVLRDGFEYSFDPKGIFLAAVTLGFYVKPWEYVVDTGVRGIGPFGAKPFEAYGWKTLRPNRFMNRMTDTDAFWAVRKLYSLSDEHLQAVIRAGQFSDPKAPELLFDILKQRRDIIAREVFLRANPVHAFALADDDKTLTFADFAVEHGLAKADQTTWRVQLALTTGKSERFEPTVELKEPKVSLTLQPAEGEQLVVRIQTLRNGKPLGGPAHIHLMTGLGKPGLRILAIDRWKNGHF